MVIRCLGIEPWVRSFIILELEFQFLRSLYWHVLITMQTKEVLYSLIDLSAIICSFLNCYKIKRPLIYYHKE
ncbi:hypothetical protein CJF42_04990 [Pseudoalteromonas sp. NBT06-2]|nr:hypothetical protein CJF42_04990 [Pseudoalteromonas sp. NBT06-2]